MSTERKTKGATLVGQRFGKQVVLRALGGGKVEIECDCGTIKATPIQYLLDGQSKSCGCGRYASRPATTPIAVGDVFERLTVVQLLGSNGRKREVLCRCTCGTRKVFDDSALRSGVSKSCGCFRRERMAELNRSHGQSGSLRTALYRAWESMWRRTRDTKRYPSYVGITVYPPWKDFAKFRAYVDENLGERPPGCSLDRRDNNAGYKPGNLRWATHLEQTRNRSSNVHITVDGVTRCIAEWAEVSGLTSQTIRARLRYGWPEHLAVKPTPHEAESRARLKKKDKG